MELQQFSNITDFMKINFGCLNGTTIIFLNKKAYFWVPDKLGHKTSFADHELICITVIFASVNSWILECWAIILWRDWWGFISNTRDIRR